MTLDVFEPQKYKFLVF